MPPAFLNHRAPTACGTPAVAAASSLTKPAEIAAQNLLICSRFAIVGRPGDRKAARPERSDCRFHLFIAALSRRCDDHLNSLNTSQSSIPSAWRRQASNLRLAASANSYDNALAETINGLYKAELIHRRARWRSFEAVEFSTLEWVDWFNNRRLLEPIGNIPPAAG